MTKEKFEFTPAVKKNVIILGVVGLVLMALGIAILALGGHGHEAEGSHAGGHGFHWIQRLYVNLWIDNVYFVGMAIIGVFFFAIQYAAQAGWSAVFIRIPFSFGNWLIPAFLLTVVLFFITNFTADHFHIFHWLDHSLYEKTLSDGTPNPHYDAIIDGKKEFLNIPFYLIRMAVFFIIWILFFFLMKKEHFAEDIDGEKKHWKKLITYSAAFIVFFGLSSAIASWDWVMSIDTHWYSTIFGWYIFSSWFVIGLSGITLLVIFLRDAGYLPQVTQEHLHDLGKYIFAFSIFWTYIWFSQFLLIHYANIPEETIYFIERLSSGQYAPVFYLNIILNFAFPFLVLMTRDSKRHGVFLKIVIAVLLFGHWIDFYLMITPGTLSENGGFGFLEIGTFLVFAAAFLWVILRALSKTVLVARNHPMMQESLHHHT
ncbi:quinol:cytochrome C oxidoreductase [Bacteroidota bacterium]